VKRATQNILAIFAGDIASRAVGFLVTVYLARTLAPEGFGLVTIGLAVLGHLQLLTSPGFQVVEARNVAKLPAFDPDRLGGVIMVRSLLSAGAVLLTALVVALFFPADLTALVVLTSVASLIPMALYADWVLQGKERFIWISAARFGGYVVYGLAALYLVRSPDNVVGAPLAFLTGCVATAILLGVALVRTMGVPRLRWAPPMWKRILVENLPVGWAMFLGQMVINLPPLVIGVFLATTGAGQYNAAMKLVFLLLILDRVVNAVFLPAVTRTIVRNRSEAEKLIDIGLRALLVVGIAALLCGILLAPFAVVWVFGDMYGGGIIVFQILLLYVVLTLLNSVVVCALVGAGGDRMYAGAITAGTIALVFFLLVLTPLFGLTGAAIGVVLGEAVTFLLMLNRTAAVVPLPHPRVFVPPVLAGAVGAGSAWLALGAGPLPALAIAMASYSVAIVLFKVILSSDLRYLREKLV
jgi:O-antigen/teichoic acid export membrane protein